MQLDDRSLDIIFREARTHSVWLDKPVSDALLADLRLAEIGADQRQLANLGYGNRAKLFPRNPRLPYCGGGADFIRV